MSKKAARIREETWNQHKEEIITFYLENSLELTIRHMEEAHNFRASENQYTTKLKSWRISKYVPSGDWISVGSVKRKRSEEGKESDFEFYGRKRPRKAVEKEIARHCQLAKWSRPENAVLPDYITVSTPPGDLLPVGIHRNFLLRSLPWFRYTQEIETLVSKLGLRKSITQSTSATPGEPPIGKVSSESDSDLPSLSVNPRYQFRASGELHIYLPSEDIDKRKSPVSPVKTFLQRFIFLSTNNLLIQSQFNNVCDWIVNRCGHDILVYLCQMRSPSMKVFGRKVLCCAMETGNVPLAKKLLGPGVRVQENVSESDQWAKYLSGAAWSGREAMVDLLCEAGVPAKINFSWSLHHEWALSLPILHTLLAFGGHPETFITGKKPGFPLLVAARHGSLEAVKALLAAGARVDLYLSDSEGTALQAAASLGHVEVVKHLIECGANVNGPVVEYLHQQLPTFYCAGTLTRYQTPIQLCSKSNNPALVQYLMEHGASPEACPAPVLPSIKHHCSPIFTKNRPRSLRHTPNYTDSNAIYTTLQYAAINQNSQLVALLLSNGAAPDSRIAPGVSDTPLQIAARLGNQDICHLLLSRGADVNAPPGYYNGRTALQGAAESGNWKILLMIHHAGAQINAPAGGDMGLNALQAACLNGHSLIVGFLLTYQADLNAAPSPVEGFRPIVAAATHGDSRLVEDLISIGAKVNDPGTEMGIRAVKAATDHRSLPLLRLLVQNGANINLTVDCDFISPLTNAARLDWLEGVEYLLEHGGSVNDTTLKSAASDDIFDDLMSPLGWAIYHGAYDMTRVLLQHGADVLATACLESGDPQNALMFAIERESDLAIMDLLFESAQDWQKQPGSNDALAIAVTCPDGLDLDLCRLIIQKISAPSVPSTFCNEAYQRGWNELPADCNDKDEALLLQMIQILVRAGVHVDSQSVDTGTLLQRIAGRRFHKSCCLLIEYGASVNTPPTRWDGTPLQKALEHCQPEIVDLLLHHGADVNATPAENSGVTALQAAVMNDMYEMTIRLLESGADVSAPGALKNGRTAIDGAAERGHHDMVQLLLNAYGKRDDLPLVCTQAAYYAQKESHYELAQWLREYSPA
ncbi:ankyrin repeat-containing domain protein [Aspergillus californicus]